MAGKENSDLFNQHSSNEGSLPLEFDKNAEVGGVSKKEPERKKEDFEPNSKKSQPKMEKMEPQRRPTHHVPPPYKKTVQEAKGDVEIKSTVTGQDKPADKPVVEPLKEKKEVKQEAAVVESVQASVSEIVPVTVRSEVPVQPPKKPEAVPAPVVPVSVPVAPEPKEMEIAQFKIASESISVSKSAIDSKISHAATIVSNQNQSEPATQATIVSKPQLPDFKQQEMKTSNVQKNTVPVNVKKEVTPPPSHVSHERKFSAEQKVPKKEFQKTVKKTGVVEKFSTDNATVGQLLQEGRVRSGLSIDQVSISTKIKRTFIEAMERDDFDNLPASVYVNAYTRVLCQLYNIDEKLVFSLLNKIKGKSLAFTVPEEVIHQLEKGKQVNIVQENKVKRFFLIGLAACFIIVACVLITYYYMHVRPSTSTVAVKTVLIKEFPVQSGLATGASAKQIMEEMEKKLMAPYVFTMTSLPLAER